MLTQISTKISVALVIGVAVAGVACSSKDKNYYPGTVYPAGANVIPADGSPPVGAPAALVAPTEPLQPLTPEEIGPTINYTVKKGDSLWLIAKNHKSSIARLKRVNQLATDNIQIGQVLRIPSSDGKPAAAPAASTPTLGTPAPTPTPKTTPTSKFKRPPTSAAPSTTSPAKSTTPKPSSSGLKIQD